MNYKNQEEYFAAIQEPRAKPIVNYHSIGKIVKGQRAAVSTVDHPAGYLNESGIVWTSAVLSYDEATGDFETRNTFYKLVK